MRADADFNAEPAALVRRHLEERVRHFIAGQTLDVYQGLRSVSTQVSESYRSRAIVELVQNAHDAHVPRGGAVPGRIRILLDQNEGSHGHLYVANGGYGFSPSNFSKLCGVATSTKRVSDGIGYKGVGFLSVFQICAHPEIYSTRGRAAPGGHFDGFRFGVPNDAALRKELAALDLTEFASPIVEEMPRILLPIPIATAPDACRSFAEEGYATVVRLPLKNDEASSDVRKQIETLTQAETPFHLFLHRLSEISITMCGQGGSVKKHFRREPRRIWHRNGLDISEIAVSDDRRFVVASTTLPHSSFIDVIDEDVRSERIAKEWADWRGGADIGIGLPVDGSSLEGRLYNFLPMSEGAQSPLPGHLNAPFHTSIDRGALTKGVGFNEFLLDRSADLCVRAAEVLRDQRSSHAAYAVPDLLCWRKEHRSRIRRALFGPSRSLKDCPFAPSVGPTGRGVIWKTFGQATIWDDQSELLSAHRIAREAGATVLVPRLGKERLSRLEQFCAPDVDLKPDPSLVATWIERIATRLLERHKKRPRYTEWNGFYQALARMFDECPEQLVGRRLMLAANDSLVRVENLEERAARRRRSAVFFPPVRGSEQRLKSQLPKAVRRRINFLHPKLECSRERSSHAEVRRFFESNQLVRRHDAREFLRVLAGAMADPGRIRDAEAFRWSALQVALDMVEPAEIGGWLNELGVLVPTAGGWKRADRAYLGSGWPKQEERRGSAGDDLERLILESEGVSFQLGHLADALVKPFRDWKVKLQSYTRCRQFLVACGALDHLRPISVGRGRPRKVRGWQLVEELIRWSGMSERNRKLWRDAIQPEAVRLPSHTTFYSAEVPIWCLPGQDHYARFSEKARRLYARQVISLLNAFRHGTTCYVFRPDYSWAKNRTAWLTPLASFLIHEAWVPVVRNRNRVRFVTASEAWIPEGDVLQQPPGFLNCATSDFVDLFNQSDEAKVVLRTVCGLKSLSAKASGTSLIDTLGAAVAEGLVHQDEQSAFEALYERSWKDAVEGARAGGESPAPSHLAAVEADRLVAVAVSASADAVPLAEVDSAQSHVATRRVWLDDARSPLAGHMLAETGRLLFPGRLEANGNVAQWLAEKYPTLVRRASESDIAVIVDGERFVPSQQIPALVDAIGAWLPEFVAVAADLRARFARLKTGEIMVKVRQIRLKCAKRIALKIGDDVAPLPAFARGCVFCNDAQIPTIVFEEQIGERPFRLLSRIATVLDEALNGRSQLATAVSAGALELAERYADTVAPTDDDYASIFHQPIARVRSVMDKVRSELQHVLYGLRPLVWMAAGPSGVRRFDQETVSARTEEEVLAALDSLACPAVRANEWVAACKAALTSEDIVLRLGVDLAQYNDATDDLGPKYRRLDFSTEHAAKFVRYTADRRKAVRESIRVHFLDAFDAEQDLGTYVAIRDSTPEPDPVWGTTMASLAEEEMERRLTAHLSSFDVALVDPADWLGPPVTDVREQNRAVVRQVIERAAPCVRAWCEKHEHVTPDAWLNPNVVRAITGLLDDQGWLDFRPLSAPDSLDCVRNTGVWPTEMPLTLSAEELQLSAAELQDEHRRTRKQRERDERAQRTVTVYGNDIVEGETTGDQISDLIVPHLHRNERLQQSTFKNAKLQHLPVSQGDRNGGGGGGGGRRNRQETSAAKRRLIGFVGELIAFEWLKLRFGSDRVTETCWVSRNRELLHPGNGDDTKGYDFEVRTRTREWHFEVKATTGTDRIIELGVTEIADAERCRADRTHRYRVLFIESALEPQRARLHMLPNPRSERGEGRYREISRTGLKLAFDLASE
ncbi:MAG: hypothetical protein F4Z74_06445 [Acidobacteria bacterium]|nr:hypothetical protein [Acidobacteriota bacterium]MYE42944.1 hypothetical protein [Acidobacteriota bacterium]